MEWFRRLVYIFGFLVHITQTMDFPEPEKTSDGSVCKKGQIIINDICTNCPKGTSYDTKTCESCKLDTFSDIVNSLECTACPAGKYTTSLGTSNPDLCTDICVIPQTTKSYYQTEGNQEHYLKPGDRVRTGTELFFVCYDGYNIEDYEHVETLNILCSKTNAGNLPTECTQPIKPVETGLLCYDNCFKKQSDADITYLKKQLNNDWAEVDKCSYTQCKNKNDICMTISSETESAKLTQYLCKDPKPSDSDICTEMKVDGCKVTRCNSDRCNTPISIAFRSMFYVNSVLTVILLVTVL